MGGTTLLARPSSGREARYTRTSIVLAFWRRVWPAAWGSGLGVALFVLAYRAMPDDALITLSFARNLAEDGCWCLSTGIESNTATSPLNVWLLAAVIGVTGHAYWAAAAVLAGSLAAAATWLRALGGTSAALLGTAALASSPLLASAVGMETVLAAAVLVGVVRYAAADRWIVAGVMVGLAWLTRPDLVVAAVAAVLVLALARRRARLLGALAVGAAVALPWTAFSWFYFGSAYANSVAVKWANGAWDGGASSLTNPAYFFGGWPLMSTVTAIGLGAGVVAVAVALRRGEWPVVALGSGAAAHLAALSSTSTPPTAYYLGPSFAGLTLAFVLMSCVSTRRAVVLPALLVVASSAVLVAHGDLWSQGFAPIRQNWATNAEYEAMARDLPAGRPVLSTTEIGALAFYCHRRCQVIDHVLSDPGRVDGYVARWSAFHPTLAAVNYRFYRPPSPVPIAYELRFGYGEPQATPSWPITRQPGFHQWATLVPAGDPLAHLNR